MFVLLSEGAFNPLEVHFGLFFWSALTFVVLLAILTKVGWGPLSRAIEERERKIRDDIEAAEKARREAEEAMQKHRAQLDQAAEDAKRVLNEAREAGERAKEGILAEAREKADSMVAKAKKDIEAARDKALADIREQVVDIAVAISEKAVAKAMDRAVHEKLAEEVLAKAGDVTR